MFRALDTKLQRDVALKLLPDHFANDKDRLSRFQREAHLLASLNHPNIAQIYGLEDSTDRTCIVMELVEGQTLAERLLRAPVPLEEALRIAKQAAEALEAAHERGIVHRDLKPANIKLTPDGKVKVLDFGLAKAFEGPTAPADVSHSPTLLTAGPSQASVIIGTAAYMAPEQARGQTADARSDIWAFGCVLYEMLTRGQAFTGVTVTDILARIVTLDPNWQNLPPEVPVEIRSLLRRCLQKDRNRRLQHVIDARIEIESLLHEPLLGSTVGQVITSVRKTRDPLAWTVAAVSTLAAVSMIAAILRFSPVPAPELRLDITTPPASDLLSLAMSPDGNRVAFVAFSEGKPVLFVRTLDSSVVRPLPGTENAIFPFWSPDSRSLGFFSEGKLKRIDIAGGAPQTLAVAPTPRGGAWGSAGMIIYAPSVGALYSVPASGGETTQRTQVQMPLNSHRFPQFLPDGQHFLFFGQGNASVSGIYVGTLDGSAPKRLISTDANAAYHKDGFVIFTRQGTLFAQKFDSRTFEVSGDPIAVADRVVFDPGTFVSAISAGNGTIIYRSGTAAASRRLVWYNRSGKELDSLGPADVASPNSPELSPDEKHVALYRTVDGNLDVWSVETTRGVTTRLTSDASNDLYPVWSPDGKWLLFASSRKGAYDLFRKPATGAGTEELILASAQNKLSADWSSDGRFILYRETDPKNGNDLKALPLFGEQKPIPIATTAFEERDGQFSPDVRWVAYSSNESGSPEIYVQPFPGSGGKVRISTNGGTQPRWRHDGKEIFFIGPDNSLMSAPIKLSQDGSAIEPGTPLPLFHTRLVATTYATGGKQQYTVSRDGQRFLLIASQEEAAQSPITVLLNWKPPKEK